LISICQNQEELSGFVSVSRKKGISSALSSNLTYISLHSDRRLQWWWYLCFDL